MSILKLKIDVMKLDKTEFFRGKKGTYADITVLLKDEPDQYGNHGMIVQDISQERREAGEKGAIIGNAKWVVAQGEKRPPQSPVQEKGWDKFDAQGDDGDIPF